MVNVNAAVPFNLHNKRLANAEPSSSRSVSASGNGHHPHATSDNVQYLRSDIIADAEGQTSLSFSPGRSRSQSSLRSYSQTPDDSGPILNARLVSDDAVARDRGRRENKFRLQDESLDASTSSPNQSPGHDSGHEVCLVFVTGSLAYPDHWTYIQPQTTTTASPPNIAPPFVIRDAGHLSVSWDD
jgi:hypothetical protein